MDLNQKIIVKTKRIYSSEEEHNGFGAGPGDTEYYKYECPCGKGEIIEEHDNIPGFRDHSVYMRCDECSNKFEINTDHGVRNWELVVRD